MMTLLFIIRNASFMVTITKNIEFIYLNLKVLTEKNNKSYNKKCRKKRKKRKKSNSLSALARLADVARICVWDCIWDDPILSISTILYHFFFSFYVGEYSWQSYFIDTSICSFSFFQVISIFALSFKCKRNWYRIPISIWF